MQSLISIFVHFKKCFLVTRYIVVPQILLYTGNSKKRIISKEDY